MRHMLPIILLGIGLLPGISNAAASVSDTDTYAVLGLQLAQNDGPSLSEAVEQVRRQYQGRIVSAETQLRGNREVHIIKVLTDDGKVKTVRVPGRSRAGRG
ncbi:MAG: PepSY domain-containing protein [Halioglobus sp.]|nr:PepSY domain-containing protein [Halioglobus sp.]